MKKHSTAKKNQKALKKTKSKIRHMAGKSRLTIGLDLGDRKESVKGSQAAHKPRALDRFLPFRRLN